MLIATLGGCTAALSTVHLVLADEAVKRAEGYGAPDLATYEYTMAVLYLDKAREEAGYTEYRDSRDLAMTAAEWADEAVIVIQGGKMQSASEALEDLPDAPEGTLRAPPPVDAVDEALREDEERRQEHGVDVDDLLEDDLLDDEEP